MIADLTLKSQIREIIDHPQIAHLVREEYWLTHEVKPWVYAEYPWMETEACRANWRKQRNEHTDCIEAALKTGQSAQPSVLRETVLMFIDALLTGDFVFTSCPERAGEPYKRIKIPESMEHTDSGHEWLQSLESIRIGRPSSVIVGIKGREDITKLKELWANASLIETVQNLFLKPFRNETLLTIEQKHREVKELRLWERTQSLPVFLEGVVLDPDHLPDQIALRMDSEWLNQQGELSGILIYLGIAPYFTRPVLDLLALNQTNLPSLEISLPWMLTLTSDLC